MKAIARGQSYRVHYNNGRPSHRVVHVRGFVDGRVVSRIWIQQSRKWTYDTDDTVKWFRRMVRCGAYRLIRPTRRKSQ